WEKRGKRRSRSSVAASFPTCRGVLFVAQAASLWPFVAQAASRWPGQRAGKAACSTRRNRQVGKLAATFKGTRHVEGGLADAVAGRGRRHRQRRSGNGSRAARARP